MAAPQPMVKPDFFGVKKDMTGVITVYLPQVLDGDDDVGDDVRVEYKMIVILIITMVQASEEFGPISHYYLVVIPYANSTMIKHPDYYESSNLIENSKQVPKPGAKDEDNSNAYITAKFLQRSLPYTFPLGKHTKPHIYVSSYKTEISQAMAKSSRASRTGLC